MVGTERERRHVLYDGLWHFFDNLMLFKEPQGMEMPTEVQFNEFTTWIQCHNLPLACMNPEMVRRKGESVGKVEEMDTSTGGNCIGQYARVTVTREITKPLQRCAVIKTDDGKKPHTIIIRYERLPEFCQACGRVGHMSRHCDDPEVDKTKIELGPCLRAARAMEYRRTKSPTRRTEGGATSITTKTQESAIVAVDLQPLQEDLTSYERPTQRGGKGDDKRHEEETDEDTHKTTGTMNREDDMNMDIIPIADPGEIGRKAEGEADRGKSKMRATSLSPMKRKKKGELKGWKRRAREAHKKHDSPMKCSTKTNVSMVGKKEEENGRRT